MRSLFIYADLKMADGGQFLVEQFQQLAMERLKETGNKAQLSISSDAARNPRLVKFLSWMYQSLEHSRNEDQLENLRLKEELRTKRAHLEQLRVLHAQLSQRYAQLMDEQQEGEGGEGEQRAAAVQLRRTMDDVKHKSAKFNHCLKDVAKNVTDVVTVHNDQLQVQNRDDTKGAAFLSRVQLQPFFEAETSFTRSLTEYIKSQHLQSLGKIIAPSCSAVEGGGGGGDVKEALDLNSSTSVFAQGIPPSVYHKQCKELKRLQCILPVSEVKRVSNETMVQHLSAVCQWLKGAVEERRQSQGPVNVAEMRQREARLRESCLSLKQEVAILGSQRVVALAKSIANLQVSRVMHGNYDLQLARQDYFLSKQDKLIHSLQQQRSRHEALCLLMELELASHHHTNHLLAALGAVLGEWDSGCRERTKALQDPALLPKDKPKVAVPSSDAATLSLNKIIAGDSEDGEVDGRRPILTYANVHSRVKSLVQKVSALKGALESNQTLLSARTEEIEAALQSLHSCVFSPATEYISVPEDVASSTAALEQTLEQVEVKMRSVVHARDKKKKMLEKDPVLCQERMLFELFVNDSDKLQHCLAQLAVQVNALASAASATPHI